MPQETEILKIRIEGGFSGWVGDKWDMPNHSTGYHGLLKQWFDHFGLTGEGILVGERTQAVKSVFESNFREATFQTADFSDVIGDIDREAPNIYWNICDRKQTKKMKLKVDFVICQATLEHVIDPYGAVFNMLSVLKKGGRLFLHTVSPGFQEHRFPIDCYRFLKDVWIEYAKEFNVKIDDLLWLDCHCFVVYKKR